jgi:uncharacterized protein
MHQNFGFQFAGEELFALPGKALWWPAQSALLVADLHLEKGSWFAANGQLLPPYDSVETLARLAQVAADVGAAHIWCLGDNFHDPAGPSRMDAAARDALSHLAARHKICFILGNHDMREGKMAHVGGLAHRSDMQVAGIMLRHEAEVGSDTPDISGHWHPKIRLRERPQPHVRNPGRPNPSRTVARACFIYSDRHLILPAFGAFTGGLDVTDAGFPDLGAGPAVALIPTRERLLKCVIGAYQPVLQK